MLTFTGFSNQDLNPVDNIIWWEAGIYNYYSNECFVIYSSDSTETVDRSIIDYKNSYSLHFFYHGPFNEYLIFKTASGDINCISKVEDLPDFIGEIDNLAEALFITSLYGYYFIPGEEFGSYTYENGIYTLYIQKIISASGNITITSDYERSEITKPQKAIIKVKKSGEVL